MLVTQLHIKEQVNSPESMAMTYLLIVTEHEFHWKIGILTSKLIQQWVKNTFNIKVRVLEPRNNSVELKIHGGSRPVRLTRKLFWIKMRIYLKMSENNKWERWEVILKMSEKDEWEIWGKKRSEEDKKSFQRLFVRITEDKVFEDHKRLFKKVMMSSNRETYMKREREVNLYWREEKLLEVSNWPIISWG